MAESRLDVQVIFVGGIRCDAENFEDLRSAEFVDESQ
jgi:hypothetical protein